MFTGFCKSWRSRTVAVLAALLISGQGIGAERVPDAKGGAPAQRGKTNARRRTAGRSDKTEKLFGISWYNSLEAAGKAAGRGKPLDRGKPVFCLRVLGELDGFM